MCLGFAANSTDSIYRATISQQAVAKSVILRVVLVLENLSVKNLADRTLSECSAKESIGSSRSFDLKLNVYSSRSTSTNDAFRNRH